MSDPQDPDPNGLYAAMVGYHEILSSAVQAGFTRKEAFAMVLTTVRAHAEGGARGGQ
ncbi:hypothetical protein GKZ75_08375 [Kocuria indica]|uniref:Uncharacterized protein n=1 Tax=Kocuria marina subsp. indica TaxID=1049583 RepID=A0A6N9R027_9MICC|nr:hypothetical protein [Kocuria indica]NDO78237.1 hypothetical protein [Kocuria indica]